MDDLDLHTPPGHPGCQSTSFRIVESQPKPFLAKSNQWLGLTSEANTFSSRTFPEVFVGGWPGLLSDVPATFQWVLRATASTLEMGFLPMFGWYDLSFQANLKKIWCFFVFFPQESLNIEHLLILPQHKRHLVKIPLDILTADGGHCVRTLHSKSQGCLGVEFRCH